MPSYLVETFLARGAADERARRDRAASDAAEAETRAGTRVRFGGSMYVPEDEVCFLRFEAKSDRDVTLVADRAGLAPFRVVEISASAEQPCHLNVARKLDRRHRSLNLPDRSPAPSE